MAFRSSPPGPNLERNCLRALGKAVSAASAALTALDVEVERYRRHVPGVYDAPGIYAELDALIGHALGVGVRAERIMPLIERRLQELVPEGDADATP